MAKKKRGGRRLSGSPAVAAEQERLEQHWRQVMSEPLDPYRVPTDEDWSLLEAGGRARFPSCRECGGRLFASDGEEGADDQGNTVISMVLWCEYEDPEDPSEHRPHPQTDGMFEVESVLR